MSGVDLILKPMTDYDWSGLAQGSAGKAASFFIGEVDISQYREVTLEVLVKSATLPSGATLAVTAFACARTEFDPSALYIDMAQTGGAITPIAATISSPALLRGAIAANAGAMIVVGVTATSGTGTGTFKGTLQFNLALKD